MATRVAQGTTGTGQDALLTDIKGVARMLGRSERALHRDLGAGTIPAPIKLGRLTKWRVSEIREWVAVGCPNRRTWDAR
jgi:predicted DNA-binding transcriptional regulator AlpA